ncbi:hypothetical protein BSPWISOXPB_7580 [uncultured Gammaproteobacteria bacterium]|nr:hypothetical protein BSPWISOXPB_7595 [uncultured Gammaproteobacteria bacterium]VVM22211.1 hypothetical protein BSPWISOXPB_7541 [uncultured Gammaproteobacteria bacterium]VVM27960.1 hypothetical protein BSPWISOXPB_7580 [uncultured Gammaproteobacteria bacterium]
MGISTIKSQTAQAKSVLASNTIAFTACFAVWVMFSIIGIPIKGCCH